MYCKRKHFLKMGHSWPLFLYFFLSNTVLIWLIVNKVCWWLDSNHGSLVSEAAQPLPLFRCFWLFCIFPTTSFTGIWQLLNGSLNVTIHVFIFIYFCLSSTYLCDEDQTPSSQSMTARIICLQRSCHYLEQIVFLDFDRISSLTVLPSGQTQKGHSLAPTPIQGKLTKLTNFDHYIAALSMTTKVRDNNLSSKLGVGKWLWRSWQSGRLRHQRTRVRIQSFNCL